MPDGNAITPKNLSRTYHPVAQRKKAVNLKGVNMELECNNCGEKVPPFELHDVGSGEMCERCCEETLNLEEENA